MSPGAEPGGGALGRSGAALGGGGDPAAQGGDAAGRVSDGPAQGGDGRARGGDGRAPVGEALGRESEALGRERDEWALSEADGGLAGEEGPPLEVIAAGESSEVPEAVARVPAARPAREEEEEDAGPKPPLADLTARVPAALQETMDELFRARFVRVARVPRPAVTPGGA
ncbi:MAG: hypothetical protein FJ382_08095 [Verrucomicrobia bacterium]|nr:hypothetical protein [Verrucomicrobiota bacterium]